MNHKRKRPKHQRAGCLWCKPQKDEREPKAKRIAPNARRRLQAEDPKRPQRWENLRGPRE